MFGRGRAHLWGFGTLSDLPALHFILTSSEEINESNSSETCGDDFWEGALSLVLHTLPQIQGWKAVA